MPLNPAEKRRPDALAGVPVVMADGQPWEVPKPRVRFTGADGERGYRAVLSVDALDHYQALMDARDNAVALMEAAQAAEERGEAPPPMPPGHPLIRAELMLFGALLRRNYDLTPAEMAAVLQIAYDDEDADGSRIREELLDIAMGNGPKRSAGTPGSRP